MYCDNCGAEISEKQKFCDNCGSTIRYAKASDYKEIEQKSKNQKNQPYQPTRPPTAKKFIWFPIVFFMFPGLGQLYVDKIFRAVFFFAGAFIFGSAAAVGLDSSMNVFTIVMFALFSIALILAVVDSIILIRKYNVFVEENLRKPGPLEKFEKNEKGK